MKKPYKISILSPSLRGGGAEKEMMLLAGVLTEQNYDVDLVLINSIQSVFKPSPAVNLVDLNSKHIRSAIPLLAKYLNQVCPDVLFSAETPVNVVAILAKILAGRPDRLIVSERNHLSSMSRNSTRLLDRLRSLLARLFYPRADLITSVSQDVANDMIEILHLDCRKIKVINNMFDIQKIQIAAQDEPGHPWFQPGQPPLLLNVGRLTCQKDQATLIKAFASVRKHTACRLVILGEGPDRAALQNLVSQLGVDDDVWMPGFISPPFPFMSHAAVFVLSSAWEGFPNVLVEAMACGVPVISTNCPGGSKEILSDGKYGPLVPVGDVEALAGAMFHTLSRPLPPQILKTRAMDFSIDKVLPIYLDAFFPFAREEIGDVQS